MRVYFDASVLVAFIVAEPSVPTILQWLRAHTSDAATIFSDWSRAEVASAVARRVRMRNLTSEAAYNSLLRLDAELAFYQCVNVLPEDIEAARAFVLRFDLGLRLADAIHIAIARRIGATLVSLDKRQLSGARALGIVTSDPLGAHPENA